MVCFKIGKNITANYEGGCVKIVRDLSLREIGKEYNCVVCLQNGQPGARGGCAESAFGNKFNIKNDYRVI